MLKQHLRRQFRPVPMRNDFGKRRGFLLGARIAKQSLDRSVNLERGGFRLAEPNCETQPFETCEIGDLLDLHADADDWLARQRGRHNRSYSAMDNGDIGHSVDLNGGNPIGDDDVGGHADRRDERAIGTSPERSRDRLPFEALDDPRDDLRLAGASHREIDQWFVPRDRCKCGRALGIHPEGSEGPMK